MRVFICSNAEYLGCDVEVAAASAREAAEVLRQYLPKACRIKMRPVKDHWVKDGTFDKDGTLAAVCHGIVTEKVLADNAFFQFAIKQLGEDHPIVKAPPEPEVEA